MPDSNPRTTRPILFLDVDGVLLGKDHPRDLEVRLARHAEEFLAHCLAHFDCRWLTTHCRDGDAGAVLRHLGRHASGAVLELAAAVEPTAWRTLKTEVVDLESDFYVIDDCLMQTEQDLLARHGVLDRWVRTDTRRNPDDLRRVLRLLSERSRS